MNKREWQIEMANRFAKRDKAKELTDEEIRKAVEAEREACAKVCDDYDVAEDVNSCDTAEGIAIAIRSRGQA